MCPFCGSKLEYEDLLEITSEQIVAASNQRALTPPTATQEPVAWAYVNTDGECEQIEWGEPYDDPHVTKLYTHPAPRREVTVEEVAAMIEESMWSPASGPVCWDEEKMAAAKQQAEHLARAIIKLFEDKP